MTVRQRKIDKEKKFPSAKKPTRQEKSKRNTWQILLVVFAFFGSIACAWLWNYYVGTRVYTPLAIEKAVNLIRDHNEDLQRLWGTYRSHLYFGIRTRTPQSLLFGLLWFAQYPRNGKINLRYTCEQGDELPRYGWIQHDGKTYGAQEIVDDDFILTTEFLKRPFGSKGGDWTARVKGKARYNDKDSYQAVSIMFAVTNEGAGKLTRIVKGGKLAEIHGRTPHLGEFKIKFQKPAGKVMLNTFLASYEEDIYNAKDAVMNRLQYKTKPTDRNQQPLVGLPGDLKDESGRAPNFFVYQVTLKLPFQIDVVFESGDDESENNQSKRKDTLTGEAFVREIRLKREIFNGHFEKVFQLANKGFTEEQVNFGKAALSNMIGGITYLYGKSKITRRGLKQPIDYWETGLYTGVPSRSFFPRGFLWDEGFHQIMVQKWDPSITRQVLSHWLDLLNRDGWIPREQILGTEARRKVPDEFVVQHNENANPPTFFLTIQSLIEYERNLYGDVTSETLKFLRSVFWRLEIWFSWYNTTQKGPVRGSYRWHGRDPKAVRELNPKTLTSGLDDYPRASHPSDEERHVDLRCWIAVASGILADIAELLGISNRKYRETELYLKDNELLDRMHWSERLNAYADYGNHTKFSTLKWMPKQNVPNSPKHLVRVVNSKLGPSLKFVDEFGYISLFPFLLKIVQPLSPKLGIILEDIRNTTKLWTDFGLRSLSTTAPSYNKYNTEHDKPYWRGPIWININFLAVKALQHYANTEGPFKDRSNEIYSELRMNLINNIFKQYQLTGYIWEQYDDATGKGQGCYPFTGWSGLVTLIMAEKY